MLKIQADWQKSAKSPLHNCYYFVKFLGKLLFKSGVTAHIYDYPHYPVKRNWDSLPNGNIYEKIIARNKEKYLEFIKGCHPLVENFRAISSTVPDNVSAPFWSNEYFPPLDGVSLYSLIATTKPRVYMEIGSGNSTKFARQAVVDHHTETKIVSVDPYPRAEIDKLCDEVLRVPVETLPIERFASLNRGDVLFIDNSHRSFQNSDVTYFFTEILPSLKPGVIYGIHDIFLPHDYPESWAMRFYNEQYLLMTYLLGGAGGDEILFPVAYMSRNKEVEAALLGDDQSFPPWGKDNLYGGAFWMVKS